MIIEEFVFDGGSIVVESDTEGNRICRININEANDDSTCPDPELNLDAWHHAWWGVTTTLNVMLNEGGCMLTPDVKAVVPYLRQRTLKMFHR